MGIQIISKSEACRRLFSILLDRTSLTIEEFELSLNGWEFLDIDGATLMRKGNEIHVAAPLNVRGKWITRKNIKAIIIQMLNDFGEIITAVSIDNSDGHHFVYRLGFIPAMQQNRNDSIVYILKKCYHA